MVKVGHSTLYTGATGTVSRVKLTVDWTIVLVPVYMRNRGNSLNLLIFSHMSDVFRRLSKEREKYATESSFIENSVVLTLRL